MNERERWLEDFAAEHTEAGNIVLERDADGRNAEVSVEDQFKTPAHSATAVVFDIIYMKLARARSYLKAGNVRKFKEELQDVSNYALFPIVFEVGGSKRKATGGGMTTGTICICSPDGPRDPRCLAATHRSRS